MLDFDAQYCELGLEGSVLASCSVCFLKTIKIYAGTKAPFRHRWVKNPKPVLKTSQVGPNSPFALLEGRFRSGLNRFKNRASEVYREALSDWFLYIYGAIFKSKLHMINPIAQTRGWNFRFSAFTFGFALGSFWKKSNDLWLHDDLWFYSATERLEYANTKWLGEWQRPSSIRSWLNPLVPGAQK